MSYRAVAVEDIGKQYIIGQNITRYDTLRDSLVWSLTAPFRRNARAKPRIETFWALKDVNFNVEAGEVVGIIGRNGAGKSTLLKILSRITEPTEGRVRLRGRVGTLLEVGTGFHPELTGRENTYMNGAILGMTRTEIDRSFDEIVDFAGIERFMDTPVKRYSSGMYIRLAFAVAAHLETDILLVDEVLAVGDTAFQQKCLGKMNDVARDGRTVLFISHNMSAIQDLCPRTVVLHHGQLIVDDKTEVAMPYYLKNLDADGSETTIYNIPRERDDFGQKLRIRDVRLHDTQGDSGTMLQMGEPFRVQVEFEFREAMDSISVIVGIDTILGTNVTTVASEESNIFFDGETNEHQTVTVCFDNLVLNSGRYVIRVGLRSGKKGYDHVRNALIFTISEFRLSEHETLQPLVGLVRTDVQWLASE